MTKAYPNLFFKFVPVDTDDVKFNYLSTISIKKKLVKPFLVRAKTLQFFLLPNSTRPVVIGKLASYAKHALFLSMLFEENISNL